MSYTQRFTEAWELLGKLYVLADAANTEKNLNVSLANMHRAVVIIHPLDVNDVLDVDIEQSTDTAAAGLKAFHASDHDISIAIADTNPSYIEIASEELDVDGGFDCINVEVTTADTGGGGNDYVVEIYGYPRYLPASTSNLDSVTD